MEQELTFEEIKKNGIYYKGKQKEYIDSLKKLFQGDGRNKFGYYFLDEKWTFFITGSSKLVFCHKETSYKRRNDWKNDWIG